MGPVYQELLFDFRPEWGTENRFADEGQLRFCPLKVGVGAE